jgi:PAS domain S-box-containing protein
VVEQSAEGLYLVDSGTRRILETNPALQNMLGYTADELRGMELHEIVAHAREDVEANVERTLRRGTRFIRERGTAARTGRWWRWRSRRAPSTTAKSGSSAPRSATSPSASSRRSDAQVQRGARGSRPQAHGATAGRQRGVEAMSTSVSHDLRAPLRAMTGFSQILFEDYGDGLDEAGRDYLRRIQDAGERMGAMIDDLLDLSRSRAGRCNTSRST